MDLHEWILNAKSFLELNKEYAEDIERYTGHYETSKDSWYGFRAAYNLIEDIFNAYEKEDC